MKIVNIYQNLSTNGQLL